METEIEYIPHDAGLTLVQYAPTFAVLCSIGKQPFHGNILIEYVPDELLLEFMSFENWLLKQGIKEFTVESLCRTVFDELFTPLGPKYLKVRVQAQTAVHCPAFAEIESHPSLSSKYFRGGDL